MSTEARKCEKVEREIMLEGVKPGNDMTKIDG